MRPGLVALALGLAGVAVAGLWVWLAEPAATHEHYRVEPQANPVDTALWLVDRFPGYFRSGEEGLADYLEGLDPRNREYVLAQAQTLVWDWVDHELATIEADDPVALSNAVAAAVRHETLNQLEVNVEDPTLPDLYTHIGHPVFTAGVFARLVRGGTNCEGQNHLVAVLLDAGLNPSLTWLPHLQPAMVGVEGHVIVVTEGPGLDQPLYLDAWSNLSAFTLDPERPRPVPTLAESGGASPPVRHGLVGRDLKTPDEYRLAQRRVLPLAPSRDAPAVPVAFDIRAPSLAPERLEQLDDPWRIYLYARVLDLYDDPRAGELYRWVYDRYCEDWQVRKSFVCGASVQFLARDHEMD